MAAETEALRSLILSESAWRTIHGGLLELCKVWEEGAHPPGLEPPTKGQMEEIMQTVLPVVAAASRWPAVRELEGELRRRLDLPVPEEQQALGRMLVEEVA